MSEFLAPTEGLHRWVVELFDAAGSNPTEARLAADHLVGANLAGHDSHGVGMVPRYVNSLLTGDLVLNQSIAVAHDVGSMLIVDGQRGLGQSVAYQAMEKGIERARESGLALVGLRNAHHIGRVGHWAEQAIGAGLASIMFTSAMGHAFLVAPHGGAKARFLTNPFTVGVPRRDGEPLVLDFATSAIAHGKARVAYNKGVDLPPGSAIDAEGEPTNDARVMFDEPMGALRTFAGHKGYALAMIVELLGAALTGGDTMRPDTMPKGWGVYNHLLAILFDPDKLGTRDRFEAETSAFIDWVQSAEPNSIGRELGGILIPGDPERRTRAARAEQIPIDAGTMAQLDQAAAQIAQARDGRGPGALSPACRKIS
ncbi:MAG: malate/lactate/ureidoglycolate dehydrogenase [Burkholderiaceae bacterium]